MNETGRALILLISVMIFLSGITLFIINSTADVDYESNETNGSNEFISIDLEKVDDDSILGQTINGWMSILNDTSDIIDLVNSDIEDQSDS